MRIRSFVCVLAFGSLLVPMFARADGMVIAPPDYWMEETGQKAVIFYEKGVETLVLSTSFQGDAKDFAWIVPTPSKPDVSKGTQEVFTNLQKFTQTQRDIQPTYGLGSGTIEDIGGSDVTVIEEKQVDYYDVAVLAATDKDALSSWLKEKGYNYPASASYLLQEYINNNWYFVAMRVNPESLAFTNVSQQLRQGGATPVVLRFSTERIVYPLRISSFIERTQETPDDTPVIQDQEMHDPTFVSGVFDQSLSVTPGSSPVYTVGKDFPNREGGISAHIKLRDTTGAYRSILSLHDSTGADRMQFRLGTDSKGTYMQFVQYPANGRYLVWRSDLPVSIVPEVFYHVAVTWSAENHPQFYLNGEAVPTVPAYGETSWFGKDPVEGSKVVIGGRSTMNDPLNGDIDDVVVYNRQVYNGEILNLHNNAAGLLTVAQGLKSAVLYCNFNGSINAVNEQGTTLTRLDSFNGVTGLKKPTTPTISPIRSQSITLYIIANERKDATSFSTNYANWFTKQTVRDLAFASDGAPLLPAESKKLFVTVLNRNVTGTSTLEDVFFRTATNQSVIGTSPDSSATETNLKFWIFLGSTFVVSSALVVILIIISRKRNIIPSPPSPIN